MLYRALRAARILRPVPSDLWHRDPPPPDADLEIRYLGTACFALEGQGTTLVVDPNVTRPGFRRTLLHRLRPDESAIARALPRADTVLVGHAHHDHALDAPSLCARTGARLVGSRAVAMVARAAGLPERQIRETCGREDIACGPAVVRGVPSAHGKVYFDRVALAGDIEAPPPWPARVGRFRQGPMLCWYLELGGIRVFHVGSAGFDEVEAAGISCDVLCLCAIGRRYRPGLVDDAVRTLRPRYVVACHWDLITMSLEREPLLLPEVDLEGFAREVRQAGSTPVILPFGGTFSLKAGAP